VSANGTASASRPLAIFTFHGLGEPARPLPDGAFDVWLDPVDLCAVLDKATGWDDVAITFDGGNRSDCEFALPAQLERSTHWILCLTSGNIDQPGRGELSANHRMRHR
jgi:hypothetical protein